MELPSKSLLLRKKRHFPFPVDKDLVLDGLNLSLSLELIKLLDPGSQRIGSLARF